GIPYPERSNPFLPACQLRPWPGCSIRVAHTDFRSLFPSHDVAAAILAIPGERVTLVRFRRKGFGEASPGHLDLQLDRLQPGWHGSRAERNCDAVGCVAPRDPVTPIVEGKWRAYDGQRLAQNLTLDLDHRLGQHCESPSCEARAEHAGVSLLPASL